MSRILGDAPSLRESHRPTPDDWLRSGEYLPSFMRDFHDQKDLFKAMQDVVERQNQKHPQGVTNGLTWVAAHVYTIDVFLWVMARRGYTLQRSRKRLAFSDIHEFIEASKTRWREASSAALRSTFQGIRKDGSSL